MYHVGIKYDKWNSAVEAALFRDLVALQEKTDVMVICEDSACDRLLSSLGIRRLSLLNMASLWIVYQVESQVDIPGHVEVIVRNFIQESVENRMQLEPRVSSVLPEQSRPSNFNPFKQAPPANVGGIPVDPRVALLFT